MPEIGIHTRENTRGCRGYDPWSFMARVPGKKLSATDQVKRKLWQIYLEQTATLREQLINGEITQEEFTEMVRPFRKSLVESASALTMGQFRVRAM